MTIRETLHAKLVEHGMFDEDADAVLKALEADPTNEPMYNRYTRQDRWAEEVSGYPPPLLAVLWLKVRHGALAYIKRECPEAWFRPLFEDEPAAEREFGK